MGFSGLEGLEHLKEKLIAGKHYRPAVYIAEALEYGKRALQELDYCNSDGIAFLSSFVAKLEKADYLAREAVPPELYEELFWVTANASRELREELVEILKKKCSCKLL